MPHYRYVGPNDHYLSGGDTKLEPGDVVDVDEAEVESFPEYFERVDGAGDGAETATDTNSEDDSASDDDQEEPEPEPEPEPDTVDEDGASDDGAEDVDEASTDDGAEEPAADGEEVADPPLDPTQFTVDDLKTELDAGDFSDAELDALEEVERADDDPRTTALDAIEAAR